MGAADDVSLIDHHCHGILRGDVDAVSFESLLSESFDPPPEGTSNWDRPLGLAIRRWCAPELDLEPLSPADGYLTRRSELGADEVARRLFAAAGLEALLVDTGHRAEEILGVEEMADISGTTTREVVRLERVAEAVAASGVDGAGYPEAFERELRRAAANAVGLKTIVAYRGGFDFDPARPGHDEVVAAAETFTKGASESGRGPRLTDTVLLRFGIWAGIDLSAEERLPLQFHAGYGDPDLRLHLADPARLEGLMKAATGAGAEFVLLHCYPFHREAAYMADVYPHVSFDVGWLTHYAGPSAGRVVAEALEVAPFTSQLYSSDAFGLPEQYLVAAAQFRRALGSVLDRWIADGDCTAPDADRIVELIARENARRLYTRLVSRDQPTIAVSGSSE